MSVLTLWRSFATQPYRWKSASRASSTWQPWAALSLSTPKRHTTSRPSNKQGPLLDPRAIRRTRSKVFDHVKVRDPALQVAKPFEAFVYILQHALRNPDTVYPLWVPNLLMVLRNSAVLHTASALHISLHDLAAAHSAAAPHAAAQPGAGAAASTSATSHTTTGSAAMAVVSHVANPLDFLGADMAQTLPPWDDQTLGIAVVVAAQGCAGVKKLALHSQKLLLLANADLQPFQVPGADAAATHVRSMLTAAAAHARTAAGTAPGTRNDLAHVALKARVLDLVLTRDPRSPAQDTELLQKTPDLTREEANEVLDALAKHLKTEFSSVVMPDIFAVLADPKPSAAAAATRSAQLPAAAATEFHYSGHGDDSAVTHRQLKLYVQRLKRAEDDIQLFKSLFRDEQAVARRALALVTTMLRTLNAHGFVHPDDGVLG